MSFESARSVTTASDRFARPLIEGDEVLLHLPDPILFRVVSVRPALDPHLPNNTVHIDLAATLTFTCPAGSRNRQFIRTRTAEEAGVLPFKRLSDESPSAGDGQ